MIDKEVIMLVGASASGKTTYAKKKEKQGYVVISRDDIRANILKAISDYKDDMNLWDHWEFNYKAESLVNKIQSNLICNAMIEGKSIVIADTNLSPKTRSKLIKTILGFNTQLGEDYDIFFKKINVDLETLLKRNEQRINKVGRFVIERQYNEMKKPYNEIGNIESQYLTLKQNHEDKNKW